MDYYILLNISNVNTKCKYLYSSDCILTYILSLPLFSPEEFDWFLLLKLWNLMNVDRWDNQDIGIVFGFASLLFPHLPERKKEGGKDGGTKGQREGDKEESSKGIFPECSNYFLIIRG